VTVNAFLAVPYHAAAISPPLQSDKAARAAFILHKAEIFPLDAAVAVFVAKN
jgi:hypothetical protein